MPRDLKNKVILISGASSGIGRATALACAWAGMHVSIAARRGEKLQQVARQVSDLNRRAHFFSCNVAFAPDVTRWVDEAHRTFGRVDAVFANAGYGYVGPAMQMSVSEMRQIFDVNYFGTVYLLREALPYLRRTPDGLKHLLVCSSCLSEFGPPGVGVYSATKAAQDSLAQAMRAELAGEGISVTSVHPVGTKTEFSQAAKRSPDTRTAGRIDTPGWLEQTPEKVAKKIVASLRKPKPEVWPMPSARLAAAAMTAFPGLTAWALRRGYQKKRTGQRIRSGS